MDEFIHIRVLLGIIFGLALTHLLKGSVSLIESSRREKAYWLHLCWAAYIFLLIIHFWWWEFALIKVRDWDFIDFFNIVLYTTLFYVIATILFPDSLEPHPDYREYFYDRKKWLFTLLACTSVLDVFDTILKGDEHIARIGPSYFVGIAVQIAASVTGIFTRNQPFHIIILSGFFLYRLFLIYKTYYWISI